MKRLSLIVAASALLFASCGNMSNNVNEDHSGPETSPVDSMNPVGSPNTTGVPVRDTYNTNMDNSTSGPDNAVPKATAMDSSSSVN